MAGKVFRRAHDVPSTRASDNGLDLVSDHLGIAAETAQVHCAAGVVGDIGDRGEVDVKSESGEKIRALFGLLANVVV